MATDRLIPLGVWYEGGKFFSLESSNEMGSSFYNNWQPDWERFPQSKGEARLHVRAIMSQTPNPRAERPRPEEFRDSITLLFDMAAKQGNPKIRQSYIQVGAWLRDLSEGE